MRCPPDFRYFVAENDEVKGETDRFMQQSAPHATKTQVPDDDNVDAKDADEVETNQTADDNPLDMIMNNTSKMVESIAKATVTPQNFDFTKQT